MFTVKNYVYDGPGSTPGRMGPVIIWPEEYGLAGASSGRTGHKLWTVFSQT